MTSIYIIPSMLHIQANSLVVVHFLTGSACLSSNSSMPHRILTNDKGFQVSVIQLFQTARRTTNYTNIAAYMPRTATAGLVVSYIPHQRFRYACMFSLLSRVFQQP